MSKKIHVPDKNNAAETNGKCHRHFLSFPAKAPAAIEYIGFTFDKSDGYPRQKQHNCHRQNEPKYQFPFHAVSSLNTNLFYTIYYITAYFKTLKMIVMTLNDNFEN